MTERFSIISSCDKKQVSTIKIFDDTQKPHILKLMINMFVRV
jgi:hypothetical protein